MSTTEDWSKPQAQGDPEGGVLRAPEQGRYGPIYPENAGLPRLHDHREDQARHRGRRSARTARGSRTRSTAHPARARTAASCTTCAGCCSTSAGHVLHVPGHLRHRLRQVHRGRRRAVRADGHQHDLREARGLPDGLEDERAGVRQVRPRAPVPELPRVRRVPVRHRRRDQEGAGAQAARSPTMLDQMQ